MSELIVNQDSCEEYDFLGSLNFQSDKVARSTITTGNIYAVIDPVTSGFAEMVGVDKIPVEVPLYNGRLSEAAKTVDQNGFELANLTLQEEVNFSNDDTIVREYYPQMAEYVKTHMNAYKAYSFSHYVRSGSGTMEYEIKNGQKIGGPANIVHNDYALDGAPKRRDNFAKPPANDDSFRNVYGEQPLIPQEELDTLKHRRFAIINVWRSIAPSGEVLVDMPLCFCDTQTNTANDFGIMELRYIDRMIDTNIGFHSPKQRWYYYPEMTRDEAVLLKTFDSQGQFARDDYITQNGEKYAYYHWDEPVVPATYTLHSAVKDPRVDLNAPKRKSIEVRVMVFY